MDFTFLKNRGQVAFTRSDAEQAEWSQDEMTVTATFPYLPFKVIERGMIMLFQDPATGNWQAFEVRSCASYAYDMYQQITAESLAVAELTDSHIGDDIELSDVHADQALAEVLPHTGWEIGTVEPHEASFGDIGRGSVWQAIGTISSNWNVYIVPRVTVNSGGITGRYLDVLTTAGVWNGVRLSIDKNMTDPCVTYDDSELYTALYGYGATYTEETDEEEQETKETVFDDVVWTKTDSHPAKPAGQRYLEDPEKTAVYGREGWPRFGYYQNGDIDDPNILLGKTWESLQQCSSPKINIKGTVTDLYRLGYADKPLRLHDLAIIEIQPIGIQEYRQIIKLTVNLLDPSQNMVEIGDYIPNIIYIARETNDDATGGGKASAGGGTKSKKQKGEFETHILQNERNIDLNAKQIDNHGNILNQAGMYIDPITGVLIYAEGKDNMIGAKFHVQKDMIEAEVYNREKQGEELSGRITVEADRITAEVKRSSEAEGELSGRIDVTAEAITAEVKRATEAEGTISGSITVEAGRINQIVEAVGADGKVTAASICLAINDDKTSSATINADKIYLLGQTIANTITADYISTKIATIPTLSGISASFSGNVTASGAISGSGVYVGSGTSFSSLAESIKLIQIIPDGSSFKLQYQKFSAAGWIDASTFTPSSATSLSGSWSSGHLTVTASPQGTKYHQYISSGDIEDTSQDGNTWYVPILARENPSGGATRTGYRVYVSAAGRYTAGWEAYYDSSYWQKPTSSNSWTCKIPNKAGNGSENWTDVNDALSTRYQNGVDAANASYSKWNGGATSTLYYWDTDSLSYKIAVGSGKYWFYK